MPRFAGRPADRTSRAVLAPERALPGPTGEVPPWPGRAVRLDGRVTYVRETPPAVAGAAPALYLHGLGGSSTNWTELAALLAGHVAGTAIDLPGSGYSDPADRYSIAAYTDHVTRWITATGSGPVHLLGNSLGGTVAIRVAAARPDLVRSLTLVSPALPFLDPRRSLQSRIVPLLAVPRADQLVRALLARIPPADLTRRVLESCLAEPDRVTGARFAEAVAEIELRYTADHYVTAYLRTLRGIVAAFLRSYLPGDGSLWRAAAAVRAPTLVVGGCQDRMVDVRLAPQTAWTVPDSRLLMLDRVGHMAQLEAPRTVARAVIGMWNGSGPDRRGPDDAA